MSIAYITQAYPPMVSGASVFPGQLTQAMTHRGMDRMVIAPSERLAEVSDMNHASLNTLIVTYNSINEVPDLLNDLRLYTPYSETIVVDNASQDQTADFVQAHYPEIQLIRNLHNLGYARAVNKGFGLCRSEYVLLLNPDMRITGPELVDEMLKCIACSRKTALVAPLQVKPTDKGYYLNFTWSYWTPRAFGFYVNSLLTGAYQSTQPIKVTYLNAGCLLIQRSAFEQVGMFDERYFMYGEEPDLCLKLKRQGFECELLTNVAAVHYRERSLGTVPALRRVWIRSQALKNIIDALLRGWLRILLDHLMHSRPEK